MYSREALVVTGSIYRRGVGGTTNVLTWWGTQHEALPFW